MAATLEQVVKQLTGSGIIAPGKLENFIPPKADSKSGEELVAQLVKSQELTRFQAQHIVAIADDFEIASGGTLDIKARLVPKAKQVAGQATKSWETPAFQAWVKQTQALPDCKIEWDGEKE